MMIGFSMTTRSANEMLLNKLIVMEKDKVKTLCLITQVKASEGIIEVLDLDRSEKIIIGFFDVIDGNISFRVLQ